MDLKKPVKRKGCSYRVRWKDDGRFGVVAVLYDRRGRSVNVIRGHKSMPSAKVQRRAERMLLDDACPTRRR